MMLMERKLKMVLLEYKISFIAFVRYQTFKARSILARFTLIISLDKFLKLAFAVSARFWLIILSIYEFKRFFTFAALKFIN
jgi:hypothetical protein